MDRYLDLYSIEVTIHATRVVCEFAFHALLGIECRSEIPCGVARPLRYIVSALACIAFSAPVPLPLLSIACVAILFECVFIGFAEWASVLLVLSFVVLPGSALPLVLAVNALAQFPLRVESGMPWSWFAALCLLGETLFRYQYVRALAILATELATWNLERFLTPWSAPSPLITWHRALDKFTFEIVLSLRIISVDKWNLAYGSHDLGKVYYRRKKHPLRAVMITPARTVHLAFDLSPSGVLLGYLAALRVLKTHREVIGSEVHLYLWNLFCVQTLDLSDEDLWREPVHDDLAMQPTRFVFRRVIFGLLYRIYPRSLT